MAKKRPLNEIMKEKREEGKSESRVGKSLANTGHPKRVTSVSSREKTCDGVGSSRGTTNHFG